jgi:hypothetical protein
VPLNQLQKKLTMLLLLLLPSRKAIATMDLNGPDN